MKNTLEELKSEYEQFYGFEDKQEYCKGIKLAIDKLEALSQHSANGMLAVTSASESILYKDQKDFKYKVEIKQQDEKIKLIFSCDGGKFGTEEILDEAVVTPLELFLQLKEISAIKQKHAIDFASGTIVTITDDYWSKGSNDKNTGFTVVEGKLKGKKGCVADGLQDYLLDDTIENRELFKMIEDKKMKLKNEENNLKCRWDDLPTPTL